MRPARASARRGVACSLVLLFSVLLSAHRAAQVPPHQPSSPTPDIYFAPTPPAVAEAMLKLARVNADDVVYDLGSGDGRIVILAAQRYGARAVGIELEPHLIEASRAAAIREGVSDRVRSFTAISSRPTSHPPLLSRCISCRASIDGSKPS